MPRISEFYGIVIAMFHREHQPPHFHAFYAEFKAQISIKDGNIIEGKLPPKAKTLVKEWTKLHQEELLQEWNLAQQHKSLFWIEPLQ